MNGEKPGKSKETRVALYQNKSTNVGQTIARLKREKPATNKERNGKHSASGSDAEEAKCTPDQAT